MTFSALGRLTVCCVLSTFGILAARPSVATTLPRPSAVTVQLTRSGTPIWRPVDFHLFTAPVGSPADGYAEWARTAAAVLAPSNQLHPPPYDTDIGTGVHQAGFHDASLFDETAFTQGNGVVFGWMLVPDPGVTGNAREFDCGPVIPNSILPISITGIAYLNGQVYDPQLVQGGSVPPDNGVDGRSHFPALTEDDVSYGPSGVEPRGHFVYDYTALDQQGNGWRIVVQFDIVKNVSHTFVPIVVAQPTTAQTPMTPTRPNMVVCG